MDALFNFLMLLTSYDGFKKTLDNFHIGSIVFYDYETIRAISGALFLTNIPELFFSSLPETFGNGKL